jgi:hypothetical protein
MLDLSCWTDLLGFDGVEERGKAASSALLTIQPLVPDSTDIVRSRNEIHDIRYAEVPKIGKLGEVTR